MDTGQPSSIVVCFVPSVKFFLRPSLGGLSLKIDSSSLNTLAEIRTVAFSKMLATAVFEVVDFDCSGLVHTINFRQNFVLSTTQTTAFQLWMVCARGLWRPQWFHQHCVVFCFILAFIVLTVLRVKLGRTSAVPMFAPREEWEDSRTRLYIMSKCKSLLASGLLDIRFASNCFIVRPELELERWI